ncbi:MAG: hypothetical protein JRI93_15890 [Deltaproteobacteria bacterium]|nr:hypothetical protein [Deltaproteobacteria bacterium]
MKGFIIQTFISEYCPHCEAEIEWRSGLFTRNTLGPENEKCPHCGKDYVTGRKEWAQMSRGEDREYYRRTGLRCLAVFGFWVMGVMLVAFMVTGAMFRPAGQTAMLISLVISILGGLALAVRVLQLAMGNISKSIERSPVKALSAKQIQNPNAQTSKTK